MTKFHGMHHEIPARILEELDGDDFLHKWGISFASGEQRYEVMGKSDGFEYIARVGLFFYKTESARRRDYLNILVGKDGDYRFEFMAQNDRSTKDIFVRALDLTNASDLIAKHIFGNGGKQ